jgi:hypothetical protein
LKFGDVITAVASLAVIEILLTSLLMGIFLPVISTGGKDVAIILGILVSSLIVGYMFAAKIREESRREAIGSIVVLFALVNVMFVMALFANPLVSPALRDMLDSDFSTATVNGWSNLDMMVAVIFIYAMNAIFALVFGSIGLYVGSMRKPSARTKK